MSDHVIVVEKPSDWAAAYPGLPVVTARDYVASREMAERKRLRVINLSGGYRYLSLGYYCSLLAEARGHRVVPTVRTIQDLSQRAIISLAAEELEDPVQRALARLRGGLESTAYETLFFFGRCEAPELHDLGRLVFESFPCPILKAEFRWRGTWRLHRLRPLAPTALSPSEASAFAAALERYLARGARRSRPRPSARFDLAMLHDRGELLPPSNERALRRFVQAGRARGVNVELIERQDFGRLAEYDGLFIRETTRIDHHTYRFARKAEAEQMVVIDDPNSILKCTNKVYLAELLQAHKVPAPRTLVLRRDNLLEVESVIPYPVVLKIPDGSFSRGVFKAADRTELESIAGKLFAESDLILAQEFLYTPFDWRIGMLDRKPLYACRYYMSRRHWQILDHGAGGKPREGAAKAFGIGEVPREVLGAATRAANLIGDSLYGVDVKQTDAGAFVIEVNDNPSIDAGYEDAVLGDRLYEAIVDSFIGRLERRGR
ncbi:MAG: RimK family protein [Chromatiales bacterium]|nr:RimK family protein [Chromatiales bacterium]